MLRNFALCILLLLSAALFTYSQDRILLASGEVIQCSVLEVDSDSIVYSQPSADGKGVNQYHISKEEVVKITYASGIEQYFGKKSQHQEVIINEPGDTHSGSRNSPARIFTTDGKGIECSEIEKKRFGFSYARSDDPSRTSLYIPNSRISHVVYADGRTEYVSGSPDGPGHRAKRDLHDLEYLNPNYVSVNLGPSIPFGLFSSSNSVVSGNAATGFDLNIDASYYLLRGLGFSFLGGYTYDQFVPGSYYRNSIMDDIKSTAENVTVNRISTGNWDNFYLLGGIGYYNDFPRILIDYKVLLGALFSKYPTASVDYLRDGVPFQSVYEANATAFAFGGGVAMRYFINRKISIRGSLNMILAKPVFAGILRSDYANGEYDGELVFSGVSEKPISIINLNLGVCYTLGR